MWLEAKGEKKGGCTLAMLRWTKTVPAGSPMIWLAGTRASEHPIHRYFGACFSLPCSSNHALLVSDHVALASRRCLMSNGVACWACGEMCRVSDGSPA